MSITVIKDDGQNVRVAELYKCPFCGVHEGGDTYCYPYVQCYKEPWGGSIWDARVVCSQCHISTTRDSSTVSRIDAIEKAVKRWNTRKDGAE